MNQNQAHIPPGMLIRVIQDKQDKIGHYGKLQTLAFNKQDIEAIKLISEDEKRQLSDFIRLFTHLFGEQPDLSDPGVSQIDSLINGLQYLFIAETNTYRFYSNVLFSDPSMDVQNVFRQAFMDENIHTTQLNHIFIGVSFENQRTTNNE